MNRNKIDGLINFPIAQPVFPDIGIGDGNGNLRFDRTYGGNEVGCGHLAAQQHLISDHHRCNDAGEFLCQANDRGYLSEVFQPVAAEPNSLNDFQARPCRELGNLIEAVFNRIGAHAIGDFGELFEITGDLLGSYMCGRRQRALGTAKRRIRYAHQLGVGIDRRARQHDRRGQPPPDRGNRTE